MKAENSIKDNSIVGKVLSENQQREIYRNIDLLAIPLIVLLFAGIFSFHFALRLS